MTGSSRSVAGAAIVLALLLLLPGGAAGHHKDKHEDKGPGQPAAPGPSPDFGFNYNTQPEQPGPGPRHLPASIAAPLQVAVKPGSIQRLPADWREIERSPDVYSWDRVDERFGALADAGLRILPSVAATPNFRRDPVENLYCSGPTCIVPPADTPEHLDAWEELVLQVVNHLSTGRYAGSLVGVGVWNEPNWTRYWQTPDGPDPARLARMVCRARRAVDRSLSPHLPVGVGGIIPWDDVNPPPSDILDRNIPMREFLNGMYATQDAEVSDLRDCMDAVAIHPYFLGLPPDNPDNFFLRSINSVRSIVEENDDSGRSIWITETGVGVGNGPTQVPDEETQADMVECAYRLVAQDDDLKIYLQHTLVDFSAGDDLATTGAYRFDEEDNIVPRLYRDRLAALFSQYGDSVPAIDSCSEI